MIFPTHPHTNLYNVNKNLLLRQRLITNQKKKRKKRLYALLNKFLQKTNKHLLICFSIRTNKLNILTQNGEIRPSAKGIFGTPPPPLKYSNLPVKCVLSSHSLPKISESVL